MPEPQVRPPLAAPRPPVRHTEGRARREVLVADEDRATRARIAGALRADGHHVVEAASILAFYRAVWDWLHGGPRPDLLVTGSPMASDAAVLDAITGGLALPTILVVHGESSTRWTRLHRPGMLAVVDTRVDTDDLRTLALLLTRATRRPHAA